MKKNLLFLLALTLMFSSCLKDEQNYSTLSVTYPTYGYRLLMADQTRDSICFKSTESGTLKSNADWLTLERNTFNNTLGSDYIVTWSFPVTLQPNTTGVTRYATVTVQGGEYESGAYYLQTKRLGVTRPTRFYTTDLKADSICTLTDSALTLVDSIQFTTYDAWSLQVQDASWLTAAQTSGTKGAHTIRLTLEPNTSSEDRYNNIVLTSVLGINDTIPVKQVGRNQNL